MGNTNVKPVPKARVKKYQRWKVAERPSPPSQPIQIFDNENRHGAIVIKWERPQHDGASPIIGYLVEYRREGTKQWIRAVNFLTPHNEMCVTGLDTGWHYQFRVFAENSVGLSNPSEESLPYASNIQSFAVIAPRFILGLTDKTALEHNQVEFVTRFAGNPLPKVLWYKDSVELVPNQIVCITVTNCVSTLILKDALLDDDGEIKCTLTNKAGHVSTKARLNIEAPPRIIVPSKYDRGLLFEIGETIKVKVQVIGKPTPLIFWTHNGESVQNDERHDIDLFDAISTLKLDKAIRDDRGEYTIKAVNKIGEDCASILLTITDRPSPPGQARVLMTLGTSVTLSWSGPKDDGGSKIGSYIIEYYRLGWNMWLKAATSRQMTTVLGDLIEGSEYKFRIKAENPYGVSEPGTESEIVIIPNLNKSTVKDMRSVSQPKDIINDIVTPVLRRRQKRVRSQSSSRVEALPKEQSIINLNIKYADVPQKPQRLKNKNKIKSQEYVGMKEYSANDNFSSLSFDPLTMSNYRYLYDGNAMTDFPTFKIPKTSTLSKNEPIVKAVTQIRSRSSTPNNLNATLMEVDGKRRAYMEQTNTMSGSSEFMLVLCPDEAQRNKRLSWSDEEYFKDDTIIPPISLSAPELGTDPTYHLSRFYSSSELLYDRRIIRMNSAMNDIMSNILANVTKDVQEPTKDPVIPEITINSIQEAFDNSFDANDQFLQRYDPLQGIIQRRHSLKYEPYILRKSDNGQRRKSFTAYTKKDLTSCSNQPSRFKEPINLNLCQLGDTANTPVVRHSLNDEVNIRQEKGVLDRSMFMAGERSLLKSEPVSKSTTSSHLNPIIKMSAQSNNKRRSLSPMPDIKKRSFSLIPDDSKLPNVSARPVEEQIIQRQRSRSLIPIKLPSILNQKTLQKDVKISPPEHSIAAVAQLTGITASAFVIPKSLTQNLRQNEDSKVAIHHYGDIVEKYRQSKLPTSNISQTQKETLATARNQSKSPLSHQRNIMPFKEDEIREQAINDSLPVSKSKTTNLNESFQYIKSGRNNFEHDKKSIHRRSPLPVTELITKRQIKKDENTILIPQASTSLTFQSKSNVGTNFDTSFKKPLLKEIMTQTSFVIERQSSYWLQYEAKVMSHFRNKIHYMIDFVLLFTASWLYAFHDEVLAIPILLILVFRQLKERLMSMIPKWITRRFNSHKNNEDGTS